MEKLLTKSHLQLRIFNEIWNGNAPRIGTVSVSDAYSNLFAFKFFHEMTQAHTFRSQYVRLIQIMWPSLRRFDSFGSFVSQTTPFVVFFDVWIALLLSMKIRWKIDQSTVDFSIFYCLSEDGFDANDAIEPYSHRRATHVNALWSNANCCAPSTRTLHALCCLVPGHSTVGRCLIALWLWSCWRYFRENYRGQKSSDDRWCASQWLRPTFQNFQVEWRCSIVFKTNKHSLSQSPRIKAATSHSGRSQSSVSVGCDAIRQVFPKCMVKDEQ